MANLRVLDAVEADKYLKASGAGTDVDPHIPEHKETSAAGILAAAQAIQTAAAAIQAAVETLDNIVAGSEAQVDVVSMPSTAVTGPLTDAELRASAVPVSGTVTASGPLTDTELRNTAVPVSAATLPLPTGAATSAKQDTEIGHLATLAGVVAGTEMQVDVLTLPDADLAVATITTQVTTEADSGDNTVIAAPGADTRIVVKAIVVQNESATATTILLKSGANTKRRALLQNQGDGVSWVFGRGDEWRLGTNEALVLNLSGANSHGCTVDYLTEAV